MPGQIEIYQTTAGETRIEVKFDQETVWLTINQMALLFDRDKSVVSRHIKSIYTEGELEEKATVAKNATVQTEGRRLIEREIEYYNLDVVISVGYRVKSPQGTKFRQWATQHLKDYLIQGYAINEKRLAQKQQEVQTLKNGIRILSRAIEVKVQETGLDWLQTFAKGLELLDDYDHEQLDTKGVTKRPAIYPGMEEYQELIHQMKADFDSAVFGKEKDGSFQSAVAQITKGFGDEDFYPSLEEKADHEHQMMTGD